MNSWQRAHVAFGSNVGDRRDAIHGAMDMLRAHPQITLLRCSSLHETEPVGPLPQEPYLNAAAVLETTMHPRDAMAFFLQIESVFGRNRQQEQRWGPRTLDLDLLLYGNECECIMNEPGLTIPHPRLHERVFVLQPLAEIDPGAMHPLMGQTVQEMLDAAIASRGAAAVR